MDHGPENAGNNGVSPERGIASFDLDTIIEIKEEDSSSWVEMTEHLVRNVIWTG